MDGGWRWTVEELAAWADDGRLDDRIRRPVGRALPRDVFSGVAAAERVTSILDSSVEFRENLARLFAASALLYGAQDDVWDILERSIPEMPLAAWRRAAWRLSTVPCVKQSGPPVLVTILSGHAETPPPEHRQNNLTADAQEAVELAAQLASKRWGGHFVCWNWSENEFVRGASLGLPVFLAFGCAANGLDMPMALATGKLDEYGRVLSVGGVTDKEPLAMGGTFFIPAADYSDLSNTFLPVSDVDEAFELWECCGQGVSPERLRTMRLALDEPQRFFTLLLSCTPAELMHIHRPDRISRLRKALESDLSSLSTLQSLLRQIASSKENRDKRVREFLLDLFPRGSLPRMVEEDPSSAWRISIIWRLSMLHMRALNHSGHVREARELRKAAREWEWALDPSDEPEELISHALAVVGMLHNSYCFNEDPWQVVGSSLVELIDTQEKRIARGQLRNKPLGDWYGTVAQHYAFRKEPARSEEYLERAYPCFEGLPEDQRQVLCYRFFMVLDTGDIGGALANLLKYIGISKLDGRSLTRINRFSDPTRKYSLFALVRFAADALTHAPQSIPLDLQRGLNMLAKEFIETGRTWEKKPRGHPWQLIMYNLGFIVEEDYKRQMWDKSLELCLCEKAGPTMNAMALLPLSAMLEYDLELPENAASKVQWVVCRIKGALNEAHFKDVVNAPTWKSALETVRDQRARLFPFNYR